MSYVIGLVLSHITDSLKLGTLAKGVTMKKLILLLSLLVTVVPPSKPKAPSKMCFLVDKSGSMSAEKSGQALEMFLLLAMSGTDSAEMNVKVFNSYTYDWGYRWQALPSKDVVDRAHTFLTSAPALGSTKVLPALAQALAEKKADLSIILITDGEFDELTEDILTLIKNGQKMRKEAGLPPAVIGCVGIGKTQQTSLKKIATLGGGGYYHMEADK